MSARNNGSLSDWLREHSYSMGVALVLIAFNYGVMVVKLDAFDEKIKDLEQKIEQNSNSIRNIEVEISREIASLKVMLQTIIQKQERTESKLDTYDNNIRIFYEKYGGALQKALGIE